MMLMDIPSASPRILRVEKNLSLNNVLVENFNCASHISIGLGNARVVMTITRAYVYFQFTQNDGFSYRKSLLSP